MQARPAPAGACKGTAVLDLNMPGKHARSTDTMHARPPRARMCTGIAETWQEHQSNTMQALPAPAGACKGIAGLDLNMPAVMALYQL